MKSKATEIQEQREGFRERSLPLKLEKVQEVESQEMER